MDKVVKMEVPEQLLTGLDINQMELIQEIIQLGVYQFKILRALDLYRSGVGSLGYAAEKMNVSKRDLIREARARGIEPGFDDMTVVEELGI